jgi:RNA polymerase sigma factor (sigma-70 family)
MRVVNVQNQDRVESFDSLLEWLDPDRERAAEKYVEIRQSLIQIFTWRRCSDAESLADETLDRVISRVSKIKGTYEGNPSRYIHAVAKNVLAENMRAPVRTVELADSVPESQRTTDSENERMYCLERCLSNLSPSSRDLIQNYYSEERTKKQSYRRDLSKSLGITHEALRVRLYRIRKTLETCVQACMEQQDTI